MPDELLEIDVARERVLAEVAPLAAEPVPLAEALGRVLAADVLAADDVPGFDNSAMDGYAVRAADTVGASGSSPATLDLVGESRAGRPADLEVAPGQTIGISTGAMVPAGADAVVRVEDTSAGDRGVDVRTAVEPGRDIRRAGEDIRAGDTVIRAGTRIGPAELGVLASVGVAEPECARRPRIAIVTTGDELVGPADELPPGGIRNTNAFTVPAQARRCGCEVLPVATIGDDARTTDAALAAGLACELLVVCGGVSVGPHDHVKPALARLKVEERLWGLALRPGKPTWFGVHERDGADPPGRTLVFGLPGNPVSALVTFQLLVRPAVLAMLGVRSQARRATAILDEDYRKRPGRTHAVRCRLELRDDGWHARPTKEQGSHVLTSMLGADALAMLETDRGDVSAGERVDIELLDQ